MSQEDEEQRLRISALKNAEAILIARRREERELRDAKEALERKSEELQQQREWFEVTLSSIGDAVITTDTAGKVTFLNPVAESMTGWTTADAVGVPLPRVFNIISEATRQPAENPVAKVLQTGKVVELANHTALIGRTGNVIAIEDSAAPIRDAHGDIAGAVMVFHDVTRRRRAEEALRASEERLRATFDQAAVGIASTDFNGRFQQANQKLCDVLGYSIDEIRQRTFLEVTHPDDVAETQRLVAQLRAGEIPYYVIEKRYLRKDGRSVWSRTTATVLKDAAGEPAEFIGVVEDITDRKIAERAAQENAQRLQLALLAAESGDWMWDAKTDLVSFGERAAEIFGVPADRSITWTQMRNEMLGEDAERARVAVEYALANRSDYNIEYLVTRPSGEPAWVAVRGRGIYAEDGSVIGMSGVVQDITARKLEEQLRSRLAAIVESSDDAIISKTLNSVITTWNRAAENMFGYTANEAIGKSVTLLIPSDQHDEEPQIVERLRRGERIEHYETTRVKKDGTRFDVSLSVSPIRDRNGTVIGASKIARDITRQKEVEEALRDQARVLELLNVTGASIAAQLDLQSVVQTVTDATTQLSGAQFGAFFYNVIDQHGESFLLFALSGAPRESFDKFGLPRNTPVFNHTFTGQGIVRSADITKDPRYGTMAPHHGMPKGHLPVRSYLAVPVISRNGEVIGGLFFGHPKTNVFTERSERLVSGVAAQAAIAIDNARLLESAQKEIASRQRAEAALRETDKRKDEFLATLAHELRNPLAPIRQAALISQATLASDEQKRWSHDVISRQVHHMALLLDDLLDISRITRGTLALRTEATELAGIVDAAVETAHPVMDAKRHVFKIELPGQPIHFIADPLRIAQVLSNLLTNAAKYTDPEGQIRLRVTDEDGHIIFSVKDNGIGIPAEALPDVFAMFSQVKSAQDRSEGGLGIGLALSKGLVELHGGSIEVKSAGTGQGSEFVVRLPLRRSNAPRTREAASRSAHPPVHRRVLIADDNTDAADSLAMVLRMDGHEVKVVHDGKSALDALLQWRAEVALLDIGMPGLNGYEVAHRVRQTSLDYIPALIAVTGWGQQTDKARAIAAGFDHHFTKPVDPQQLSQLLQSENLRQ